MEKSIESAYFGIEQDYFWSVARRETILQLLCMEPRDSRILDVGCGGGTELLFLKKNRFTKVFGIDSSKGAILSCKKRGIKNAFLANGAKTSFSGGEFDIVLASDVLEHIRHDDFALVEWNRLLRKGGKLIIFVPAFDFLWSNYDIASRHYRRYSRRQFFERLEGAGFRVQRLSFWNFFLFFPLCAAKFFSRFFGKKNQGSFLRGSSNPAINSPLLFVLRIENALLKHFNFPFGVSLFAVCIKRDGKEK